MNNALKKTTIAIGEYVARAFLSAVVILIGGYRNALKLSVSSVILMFNIYIDTARNVRDLMQVVDFTSLMQVLSSSIIKPVVFMSSCIRIIENQK